MVVALAVLNVAVLAVLVYVLRSSAAERKSLLDRIQAPELAVTYAAEAEPAERKWVDSTDDAEFEAYVGRVESGEVD